MAGFSSRRWRVLLGVVLAGALGPLTVGSVAATPNAPPSPSPQQEARVVATGLEVPWGMAFLPDGTALVSERDSAQLLNVTSTGEVTVLGTISGVVPGGEGGLMGVAVSPDYATDHLVYLHYTAAGDNRIVRLTLENGQLGEQEVIVSGIPKGQIHNGGKIAFGPDGMLYAGVGETGNPDLAQDLDSLGGKILRMTPDGEPAPDNPFGTLIWSYGHRNVQGLTWDTQGRMFASELGQDTWDEVNRIEPGNNYGWPIVEGVGGDPDFIDPIVTWSTAEASPSGAAILGGSIWVAGLRGQRLWEVPLNDDGGVGTPVAHFTSEFGRLRAVETSADGTLWVSTSNRDGRGNPAPDDDRILEVTLARCAPS